MLNQVKGNMYPFVTHTWNTVKGRCPHDCSYCYMKRWGEQPPVRFDEKELKTELGKSNFIFIGSSCDMWAWTIDWWWIHDTLKHCGKFQGNKYLFQSKNPQRFRKFYGQFPHDLIFGTTIETNREEYIGKDAPAIIERYCEIHAVGREDGAPTMITIEPIMDFDLKPMVEMISDIEPEWVNIGANTNHKAKLPEPRPEKVQDLIFELEKITKVKIKNNLNRLLRIP